MRSSNFELSNAGIGEALSFIEESFEDIFDRKKLNKVMLLCEETMIKMVEVRNTEGTPHSDYMTIAIRKDIFKKSVRISARGREFGEAPKEFDIGSMLDDDQNAQAYSYIQSMIVRKFGDNVRYKHRNNTNTVDISAKKHEKSSLYSAIIALVLGILFGIICRFTITEGVRLDIVNYVLSPIREIFLNLLGIVVGPVVFFSIATSMSQFTDISAIGKIGARVFVFYIFTSLIAAFIGLGIFFLFNPGEAGAFVSSGSSYVAETAENVGNPLFNMLMGIVPGNLLLPFIEGDMLQIIVLAVLIGIASTMLGKYTVSVNNFFEACNELFMKITSIIVKLIPIVLFSALAILVITTELKTLISLGTLVLTIIVGYISMCIVYCLILRGVGRLNPFKAFKRFTSVIISAFSTQSSCASMPVTMRFCESIGVPKKIYSFSVPLGATINMDGACVAFMVMTLAFMKFYNIEFTVSKIIILMVTSLFMSMATPGVAGSGLVTVSIIFAAVGVPLEAIAYFIPISTILDGLETVNNVTGDVVVTTVVSKLDKSLDLEKYNGN